MTACERLGLLVVGALMLAVAGRVDANEFAVERERPLSLRVLVDVRLVQPGQAPSWMDRGPGKARYGGVFTPGGSERVTRFALSQFALEPSAALPFGVQAHLQLNWEADIDDDGDFGEQDDWPRLIEAWLRKEWGAWDTGVALQAGVLNAPFSLEHAGPAKTPKLTLTASALNSWLWEEGRVLGFEAEWWRASERGGRIGVFAGAGWGPDQSGILLARRGWILSDYLSGVNSALPIPVARRETHVFDEQDGRPALYAGLVAADPWQLGQIRAGYHDNLGDLSVRDTWETRFATAGVATQPVAGFEALVQGLVGRTATRAARLQSRVSAWYALLSYRYRRHRLSARYDDFAVHDEDGAPSTRERGTAVTIAYLLELWLRHRIAVEYISIDSERPERESPDPSDDVFQVSYRFRY